MDKRSTTRGVSLGAATLIGALLVCVTAAQAASILQLETAEAWVERMEDALGGAARQSLHSLSASANCRGPDGEFTTEIDSFRSDWVRFRQVHSEGTTEIWSGPESSWTFAPDGTSRELGAPVRFFVRAHEFHFLVLDVAERFTDHRLGERDGEGDSRCRIINMTDEALQPASICLSETSFLPLYLEMNPEGAAGPVTVSFEEWEEIDGVRYFGAFDLTEGPERRFRYDYQWIRPNTVSALLFVEPPSTGRGDDLSALITILDDERRAHLDADAARLGRNLADEVTELSSGEIQRRPKGEIERFFTRMFEDTTYQQWEDLVPPTVSISRDATLAWVARRVGAQLTITADDSPPRQTSFISAYSATYEKRDGSWKMSSTTSTFAPRDPPI